MYRLIDNSNMTLDERIRQDLTQIYNNGSISIKEIAAFIDQYKKFRLSEAEKLSTIFNSEDSEEDVSTRGLPGFFAGDRNARTVMLMLNPGQDVALANNPLTTYEKLVKGDINTNSRDDFITSFMEASKNYGSIDKQRADNFDLKQAAFLKPWEGCGVHFPKGFLDDAEKKIDSKSDMALKAKENVLMQKLTMDLIPYASRKFDGIKPVKMELLFPYVETLFDEIFRVDRTYVIFCSAFYEILFKQYNKNTEHLWRIVLLDDEKKESFGVFDNKEGKSVRRAYCQTIRIIRKHDGKSIKAIIAHTFPNQALPNAYGKMMKYGEFCYKTFINSKI